MSKPPHPNRNRWLIAIGALKLLKAGFFAAMGFGVIKLLHKDLANLLLQATTALRFDPENRAVNLALERVVLLSPHRLREISFALFLYAVLDVIEGMGLVLEQVWAEYFTLTLTASFLPWELYEIVHRIAILKVVLILINIFVVVYLVFVVRQRAEERRVMLRGHRFPC